MKTKPVLGLALVPLVVAVLAPTPAPEAVHAPVPVGLDLRFLPGTPQTVPPPGWSPEPPIVRFPIAREAATSGRPRWPDDWPSLDPVRDDGLVETQRMGTGGIDVTVPGTPQVPPGEGDRHLVEQSLFDAAVEYWEGVAPGEPAESGPVEEPPEPPGDEEETPRSPDFFEEGRPVPHVPGEPPFGSVHITMGRWGSFYAPPERHETTGENGSRLRPPAIPPGQRHLTRGRLDSSLVPEGLHIAEGPLASGYEGIDDRPAPPREEPEGAVPPEEEPDGELPPEAEPDDAAAEAGKPVHLIDGESASTYVDFTADDEEEPDEGTPAEENGDEVDAPSPEGEEQWAAHNARYSELDRTYRLGRTTRHVAEGEEASEQEIVYGDDNEPSGLGGEGKEVEETDEWRDVNINWGGTDEGGDPFGENPLGPTYGLPSFGPGTSPVHVTGGEFGSTWVIPSELPQMTYAPSDGATPRATPGYRITTPDGKPAPYVLLGEPFVLELLVLEEEDPGAKTIDVKLRARDGNERTITLERDEAGSSNGVVRYVTRQPASLAGTSGNIKYPGTIEGLGLDLGEDPVRARQRIQILSGPDVTGGASVFNVYGGTVTAGIAELQEAFNKVEDYSRSERAVAEQLLQEAEASGDTKLQTEIRQWISRIDGRLGVVARARYVMANEPFPIYKFELAQRLLWLVTTEGPDGELEIEDVQLTSMDVGKALDEGRELLDDRYKTRAIVPPAGMDVITGYVVGMYSQFADLTGGAHIMALLEGKDEFNQETSRGRAAVRIGANFLLMFLPQAVTEYIANRPGWRTPSPGARGLVNDISPSITIRLPGMRAGGAGAPIVAGRPGRTPGDQPYPGTPRAAPRPPRPSRQGGDVVTPDGDVRYGAGVETAGGNLAYPGRAGGRRGLDAEDIRFWRERSNPPSRESIDDFNESLAKMDSDVAIARQQGVSDEVIRAALTQARDKGGINAAQFFLSERLQFEIAIHRGQRIFTSPEGKADLARLLDKDLPDTGVTQDHLGYVGEIDMVTIESVISKAHLEQSGRPQAWTVEEILYGRGIQRRLQAGEDLSQWQTVVQEKPPFMDDPMVGLHPLFGSDDLGAIRATFDGRPLRIAPEAAPAGRGGPTRGPKPDPSDAPTVPPDEAPTVPPDELPTVPPDELPTVRVSPTERGAAIEDATPTRRNEVLAPTERNIPADDVTPTQRMDGRQPTERGVMTRVVDPVTEPAALGGPSGLGGTMLEVVFLSTGGSTGEVVEAYLANHGGDDVRIQAEGLVLDPVDKLDPTSEARMEEIVDAATSGKPLPPPPTGRTGAGPAPLPPEWQGANVVRVVLEAYCLEFAAGVPNQGTVFRIADRREQQANAGFRAIVAASRRLRDAGALHPDTSPDPYFHSIRQWAIWVEERGLDRNEFVEEFVEHARKNFRAAGRDWTRETERVVRQIAPNRWNDLTAILREAQIR